jgi:Spy/CpxP family protein refolding chaperone
MEMLSGMLNLNKDQKKQFKTIMDDSQKEATPVKDQMTKARATMAEAVAAAKTDDLKKAEADYAGAEAKMHQIELGAFAKIYQMLDKDQQAKAGGLFAMVGGVFHGKNWNDMN